MTDPRQRLEDGLASLGLSGADIPRRLIAYLELLGRWNRAYNLSAVRDPGEMVTRHLLDCLAVYRHVRGGTLLDLGSGAGLPGIPLALADPTRRITLLDSNGKKIRFLRQAVMELCISNAQVVHARAENWRSEGGFDTVIARAYAGLDVFWRQARPHLAPGGVALAMKGRAPEEELAALAGEDVTWQCHRLHVPGLEAERHLVVLEPGPAAGEALTGSTP